MATNKVCPICKGAGRERFFIMHKQTKRYTTVFDLCLCVKSRIVSNDPNYTLLKGLDDLYIPLEDIDAKLKFDLSDLRRSLNLLILSDTSYETFVFHLKSFIIQERFKDPMPSIYACNSIDVLKRFYVAQDDKSCPGLQDLNKYDLLILTLGATEKNDQLNTCISQVVSNRKDIMKPTWIYLKKPYDACIWEKSEELTALLDLDKEKPGPGGYYKIKLKETNKEIKPVISKAKKTAEKGIF